MALQPMIVFCCWIGAAVTSVPGHSDYDVGLYTNHDWMFNMEQIMDYPHISTNEQSGGLFSEEEMPKIIFHESLNGKAHTVDYHDPCARDLRRVASSLRERWAISMIDADSKLPAGVLSGNNAWVGAYKECIDIQAPSEPLDNHKGFGGRYCKLSWIINGKKGIFTSALCVPDTCQETDLRNLTKLKLLQKSREILPQFNIHGKPVSKYVSLIGIACHAKAREFDIGAIFVLTLLFIILFLGVAGTSITVLEFLLPLSSPPCLKQPESVIIASIEIKFEDSLKKQNNGENSELFSNGYSLERLTAKKDSRLLMRIRDFLKCFCVIKNGTKILDTSDKGGNQFRCLHGIRFLSMAWVIFGHTYFLTLLTRVLGNFVDFLKLLDDLPFRIVVQGLYSVDSFFLMSGFLLTYLFLREMTARDGKISWLAFYLHRYWRLTPVYAVVIAFDGTISWYLMSGPFRPQVPDDACKKKWWWNLLYLNNFIPLKEVCNGFSWYLANDMQFYAISPLFLYALWKLPKIGLGIIAGLLGASWISNFAVSYHYDLVTGFPSHCNITEVPTYIPRLMLYFDKLYTKPYTRIGPYLVGVCLGYLLYKLNGRREFLSKRIQAMGWIASTVLALYAIFGTFYATPNRIENALHNVFDRYCFAASVAWVIFACVTGHGGAVNAILSHSVFIPLSRLTYCAYLIHPILMKVYYFSLPSNLIPTHFQMVVLFFGFLLASYGLAFATSLMLESPTMAIEKFFLSGGPVKKK